MEFAQLCAVGMKETQGQMVIQRPQRYDQQLQGMEKENEWRAGDPGLNLEEHPVKQGSVWFWNHLRYDYHVSLLRQNVIKTKLALAISPATQKKSLKKNIVAIESCWSIIIRQKGASSRARWRPQCIGVGGSHHAVGLEDYSKFRWSYYAPLVCYC